MEEPGAPFAAESWANFLFYVSKELFQDFDDKKEDAGIIFLSQVKMLKISLPEQEMENTEF